MQALVGCQKRSTKSLARSLHPIRGVGSIAGPGCGEWAIPSRSIGSVIGTSLFAALYFITTTLLYLDLRNRKEGYDLQLQAERLAAEGTPSLP